MIRQLVTDLRILKVLIKDLFKDNRKKIDNSLTDYRRASIFFLSESSQKMLFKHIQFNAIAFLVLKIGNQ